MICYLRWNDYRYSMSKLTSNVLHFHPQTQITHRRQEALINAHLTVNVLLKDTSTYGQEELGIELPTLWLEEQLYLLRHSLARSIQWKLKQMCPCQLCGAINISVFINSLQSSTQSKNTPQCLENMKYDNVHIITPM